MFLLPVVEYPNIFTLEFFLCQDSKLFHDSFDLRFLFGFSAFFVMCDHFNVRDKFRIAM